MYTYNKDDKSYTFSTDDLDIEELIELADTPDNNADTKENDGKTESENSNKKPTKIEVINGGNDLDISSVSDYLEIEKPRSEKKNNIVIPEDKKD